jgi:hypothetical protein
MRDGEKEREIKIERENAREKESDIEAPLRVSIAGLEAAGQ